VGLITLPAIARKVQPDSDRKVKEISGLMQQEEVATGARIHKTGRGRRDFATARLWHYTAAFLPLIEGAYV